MQLVWANCSAFNEDGSDMSNAGIAAGALLVSLHQMYNSPQLEGTERVVSIKLRLLTPALPLVRRLHCDSAQLQCTERVVCQ